MTVPSRASCSVPGFGSTGACLARFADEEIPVPAERAATFREFAVEWEALLRARQNPA